MDKDAYLINISFRNQLHRCNVPPNSYVAAMFHPTIGQRAHQSLSNTTTPELGMIPQGIRVNASLHIAQVCQSAKPTQ